MNPIDWEDIKARHTIEGELIKRGFNLRRSGRGYLMRCPLHQEQEGMSFSIDVQKQLWRCFGKCQCGGDVLKLVMELEEVDATGAAEILEGRPLRDGQAMPTKPRAPRPVPLEMTEIRQLPSIPKLYKGEQRHWDAVAKVRKLPHSGGVVEAVNRGVLRYCLAYDQPAWAVLDVDNPCNVQVRRLDGGLWFDRVKSMGVTNNWAKWPVGLSAALKLPKDPILLVEGTGDFIAAWHCAVDGYTNAIPVAMFGASNPIHDGALSLIEGRRIEIIEQHDQAGAKAADRWREQLEACGCEVITRLVPTPGEDLNDHLSRGRDVGALLK